MLSKTVGVHGVGRVDLSPILPLINHEFMQRLRRIRQLPFADLVFPGATHDRFHHVLSVFHYSAVLCQALKVQGLITPAQAVAVPIYGALHDIGHWAFAHTIERLFDWGHNQQGLRMLPQMREVIEDCGAEYSLVEGMFAGRDPLKALISHRPLGADKVAYLSHDELITTARIYPVEEILGHCSYIDGKLAFDRTKIHVACEQMLRYTNSYAHIYLAKAVAIAQRMFEQIIMLAQQNNETFRDEDRLWEHDDGTLEVALLNSDNPCVRQLMRRLRNRKQPQSTVAFQLEGVVTAERQCGKPFTMFGVTPDVLNRMRGWNPERLSELEAGIASLVGLQPYEILIVQPTNPTRLKPSDINLYESDTLLRETLFEARPSLLRVIDETLNAHSIARVCVAREWRQELHNPVTAARIREYLLSSL